MSKFSIKEILSGNWLSHERSRQQYKLILLISGLIFLYIYSGYQSQRQQRMLSDLQKELQDVQMTQLTVNSELMNKSRQSSIARMLKEKGSHIEENKTPVVKIQ
jgi:glutaminase